MVQNSKLLMKKKEIDGYHISGSYQTVAWYKSEDEAKTMCKKMNHGLDTGYYTVKPTYKH